MTPTLDKMQVSFQEKMTELQSKLQSLNSQIIQAELFLSANPNQVYLGMTPQNQPTWNRYNLLCHNRSEILTKIRKLKERMK